MNGAMDFGVLLRFLLRTLGIFALIFLVALLTPKIAKLIDRWIARYRKDHDPEQDETYGIRSIYELPPKREETAEDLDISTEDRSEVSTIPNEDAPEMQAPDESVSEALSDENFDEEFDEEELSDGTGLPSIAAAEDSWHRSISPESSEERTEADFEELPGETDALPEAAEAAAPAADTQQEAIPWFMR